MFSYLILAALAAGQDAAPPAPPPAGRETTISFAAGGNLRDWTHGEAPDVLYVRDRTERWYRVRLSGPVQRFQLDTLSYTTDPDGRLDRFQRIRFLRVPQAAYGIHSIVASPPPPGWQGTRPRLGG